MSRSTPTTPKSVLLGAAAALCLLATPAIASPVSVLDVVVTSDSVSIELPSDALSSEAGIQSVYDILKDEAQTACTDFRRVDRHCVDSLMDDFIDSVDHAGLTAVHIGK